MTQTTPATVYILSTVTFSEGSQLSDTQILSYTVGTTTTDAAHHAHQAEQSRLWKGFKRVTGGRYQRLQASNLVEALIESEAIRTARPHAQWDHLCPNCNTDDPTTAPRESGAIYCDACHAEALSHGAAHVDQDGEI